MTTQALRAKSTVLLQLLLLVLSPQIVLAEAGVWSPSKKFTSSSVASVGCARLYYCVAGQEMVINSDERVQTTPPETRFGACVAGNGPADGCNACLTSEPEKACEYNIVKK